MYSLIGVLPPSFYFPSLDAIDVITPLGKNEDAETKRSAGTTIVHDVIAQLKFGVALGQDRAQMETIEAHIAPPSIYGRGSTDGDNDAFTCAFCWRVTGFAPRTPRGRGLSSYSGVCKPIEPITWQSSVSFRQECVTRSFRSWQKCFLAIPSQA